MQHVAWPFNVGRAPQTPRSPVHLHLNANKGNQYTVRTSQAKKYAYTTIPFYGERLKRLGREKHRQRHRREKSAVKPCRSETNAQQTTPGPTRTLQKRGIRVSKKQLALSGATTRPNYRLRNQPFILSRMPLPSSRLVLVSRTYRTWGQARGGENNTHGKKTRTEHPV